MKKHKLAIAYRVYPLISKIPAVYQEDKFKLVKLGFDSLIDSLNLKNNIEYKIWIILDACPNEYAEYFNNKLENLDYELIFTDKIGNQKTFDLQLKILLEQDFSDYVYFAEDDYFYLKDNFNVALEFIENNNIDFLTTYNHPNNNSLEIANINRQESDVILYKNYKWQTQASTTMAFFAKKSTLSETKDIFLTYTKKNFDNAMWFSLTNYKLTNIFKCLYYLIKDKSIAYIFLKAYLFVPYQLFFGKKYKLWVITQSLSTHLDKPTIANEVDWQSEFDFYTKHQK